MINVPEAAVPGILTALQHSPVIESANAAIKLGAASIPNDPGYAQQWALPKIAWDQAYGSISIPGSATIAVLDTGMDATHPDLASHVVAGYSSLNSVTTGDPNSDPNGHGTSLAGIAAAGVNDSTGIAGVAYAGAKVSPVQVLGADGTGWDSDIVNGVLWAADHGANVILMGFSNPGYSQALQDAINYAWGKGVVLVAATGNDGSSAPTYPAGDAKVIGVSSTDQNDALSAGSNYGADTFIAAPGEGILTDAAGGGTRTISGTSASAAFVAGAAALLKAHDPSASNDVIAGRLARNADPAGTAAQTGNGRLNLARALADTSAVGVTPVGAPGGGPYVGPYVVAARQLDVTFAGTGGGSVTITVPSGDTVNASTSCGGSGSAATSQTITGTCSSISLSNNSATGTLSAAPNSNSSFVQWSTTSAGANITGCTSANPGSGTTNPCSFTVTGSSPAITVTFNGNTNTTTTLTRTAGTTPSVYGDTVTFGATVTASSGPNPNNAGTVTFKDGGTAIVGCTAVALSGNTASCSVSKLTVAGNPHSITAEYSGGTGFNASTSTALSQLVTAKTLTVTGITANNKVYDGTTSAILNMGSAALVGVVSGDTVTLNTGSATGTFGDKNVGTGKTVTVAGLTIGGPSAGNYTLTQPTTTASITAKPITGSFTASSKVYDGTTAAAVPTRSVSGTIAGDVVSLTGGAATFADKNVGTGKTVTLAGATLAGTDAGNYSLTSVVTTTANITPRDLTVSATSVNKVYDGTTAATVTLSDNRVAGDVFTAGYTSATFASKHVGTAKSVSVSGISIGGTDSGNYNLTNTTATASADITARPITVTAATNTKTYDGTTSAAATPAITSGAIASGDTAGFTESYDTKTAGTGKTLTPAGAVSDGNSGNNYAVTFANDTTGVITPKALTGTITAQNKVYDGTTTATATGSLAAGVVSGDVVTLSVAAANFADKNVGTAKTVTASLSLTGADAGNYTVNPTAAATANITPLAITGSLTAASKVYDGTTAATITGRTLSGVLGTDQVSYEGGSATFANKNVGTGKTITATGLSLSGADAGNYTVNSTATTTADITPVTVTGSFTANSKAYDGTTAASIAARSVTGVLTGDSVSMSGGTASFDTATVGTAKTVTGTGFTLAGADAGNYSLASTTLTTTADITQLQVTGHFTADDKVYDGTTAATIATRTLNGVVGMDQVSLTGGTASFADKHVGNSKTVTGTGFTLTGAQASNYSLVSTTLTTTASITQRPLTVTAAATDKVYDGNAIATVALSDNRVAGDVISESFTNATFSDENVGTGKTVTVSDISISGSDAGNYSVTGTTATATASITQRPLTVTAQGVNKVYDGTTEAIVSLHDDRVAGDALALSYATAAFGDKNVGTGKTVSVSGIFIASGTDAGNYALVNTTATTTADITQRGLTVSATADNKVYDGTTAATAHLSDNRVSGDAVNDHYSTASFSDKNVGTGKTVTVSGISITGTDAGNYNLLNTTTTTTASITARALTISATADNKTYDGTTNATAHLNDDRVSGDIFADSYATAFFNNKNVGSAKPVSVSGITISGADAANYTVNATASTTADVTPLAITGSITAANKVYDGTTAATITGHSLTGVISGDTVSYVGGTATFADKNVGSGKTVTATGLSLAGTDAGNYTVNSTASTTANITALAITGSFTAANKVYDGTTAATITGRSLSGAVSGDDVHSDGGSATFDTKNVGTSKTVTGTGFTLSGTAAFNYSLSSVATTTADVTARTLHVSATADDKVYDGTTTATAHLADDRASGDTLNVAYTSASFDTKDVGAGKIVTVGGISISATDAANYTVNTSTTATAKITPRDLTVSAGGTNKVYDGTTAATVTLSDDRVAGDVFADSYTSAVFADKNVGSGKTVTVSGISISGPDAGNYNLLSASATTSASIAARDLTVTASGVNKIYDGTNAAAVTLSDDRVSGDSLTDAYTGASFGDKNVGTNKSVSVSGISISGADAANYNLLNTTAATTANISARALTIAATGVNKVYDGTTTATVNLSDNRVSGDSFTESYGTASFADKNVGTGKAISVSGLSISGTDAGNYTFNTTASATADITPRALTVSAAGVNKVYDGTTTATVNLSDNRVSGDSFTESYTSASFADKNVGTGKTVSVAGISISGTDAGNYTFNTTASATADITPRALTIAAHGVNKVYDGTTIATVTLSDNRVSGDVFTDSYTGASFADKNVGTGKAVSASGISISGADTGNYTFNTSASTTADITARLLTVSATGVNKVYDGTIAAMVSLSDDRVNGDAVTDNYTSATFADKNVGTNKAVSVSGISISGTDAANYALQNTTASTTANITTRPLTVSATGVDKVYDGTTAAAVTLADDRVSGDVLADAYSGASFADKNVGTGKSVSVSGISISGTDAGNYSLTGTSATTTADITARALVITAHGVSKVYDGTTTATVTLSDDRVSGDVFTDSYTTATFDNKNVGTGKTISVSGITIGGTDAGNYTFNATATAASDVTTRPITVTAVTDTKVYDRTVSSAGLPVITSGTLALGDTANFSQTFDTRNVGTGKTLTPTGSVSDGNSGENYHVTFVSIATGSITPLAITGSVTAANKVYDGTTAATITGHSLTGVISGDTVSYVGGTATFADKNVGSGKTVTATGLSLAGTDAGNYTVNSTATTTANITARALTISATGVNKVYDGTQAATVTLSDDRVSGDVFTDSYASAAFADKNVGTAKPVSVSGISISGTDAGNYTVNTSASTTADITPLAITGSVTAADKVYDGTTAATITSRTLAGVISGDTVTYVGGTATFADKNVGTGKTVTATGLSLSGIDAGNYTVNSTATTTAKITARPLAITATADNKVYDWTTTATPHLSDNRVSGDVFTDSYALAAFGDKNVGTAKPVTVSGISISGTDAGNYTFNASASTTADITPRQASVAPAPNSKIYGAPEPSLTGTLTNFVPDDSIMATYSRTTGENVGTYTISATLNPAAALSNYIITYSTAAFTIGKASATITVAAATAPEGAPNVTLSATVTANAPSTAVVNEGTVAFTVWSGSTQLPGTSTVSGSVSGGAASVIFALPAGTDSGSYIIKAAYTPAISSPNFNGSNNTGALTLTNVAPTAALSNNGPISEGSAVTITFSDQTDPSSADTSAGFRYAFACTNTDSLASTYAAAGASASSICTFVDGATAGTTYVVKGRILDKDGGSTDYTTTVMVNNVAPTVGPISVTTGSPAVAYSGTPLPIGSSVSISAPFTDPGTQDTHTATICWDYDTVNNTCSVMPPPAGNVPTSPGPGSVTGVHSYAAAGVYVLQVTVTDKDGATGTSPLYRYVVVYDPSAGFVTGGGWIDSQANSCQMASVCGAATGRANFGFTSKYLRGSSTPTGETEFQFQAGNLNFHSTAYNTGSLVVSGPMAQYQGTGTINGTGNYTFIVTARDGDVQGGGGTDGFRIKIMDATGTNVIYDNRAGLTNDLTSANVQNLSGGSIVIHKA